MKNNESLDITDILSSNKIDVRECINNKLTNFLWFNMM